jgi:hypothetical protein
MIGDRGGGASSAATAGPLMIVSESRNSSAVS